MAANVAADDGPYRTVKATNRKSGKVTSFRVRRDATMDEISRMYAKHMGLGPAEKVGAPVEPAAAPAEPAIAAPAEPEGASSARAPPATRDFSAVKDALSTPPRRQTPPRREPSASPAAATPPRHDPETLRASSTRHLINATPVSTASAAGAASPAFGDVVEPTVEVHCDGGAGEVTLYKRGFRQGVSLDHAYRPAGEDAKP